MVARHALGVRRASQAPRRRGAQQLARDFSRGRASQGRAPAMLLLPLGQSRTSRVVLQLIPNIAATCGQSEFVHRERAVPTLPSELERAIELTSQRAAGCALEPPNEFGNGQGCRQGGDYVYVILKASDGRRKAAERTCCTCHDTSHEVDTRFVENRCPVPGRPHEMDMDPNPRSHSGPRSVRWSPLAYRSKNPFPAKIFGTHACTRRSRVAACLPPPTCRIWLR